MTIFHVANMALLFTVVVLTGYCVIAVIRKFEMDYVKILENWALSNDYRIVNHKQVMFLHPWIICAPAQRVYKINMIDRNGLTLRAWVRCGGTFLGSANPKVEVIWLD